MIKDYTHEVKAIQYTGVNREEIKEFLGEWEHNYEGENLIIPFEGGGEVEVNPVGYVIKEPSGHVYALDAVKFEEDYKENKPSLEWVKKGKNITREVMGGYIYYNGTSIMFTNGLTEIEWRPTVEDIMADDWEIYEEE